MQVDWLKKSEEICGPDYESKFSPKPLMTKEILASVGAKLLDINRTSIYSKTSPVSDEELACKEISSTIFIRIIQPGVQGKCLHNSKTEVIMLGVKARRYMNEMDIYPIYPKMNLSKRMQQAKVCPYLL